MLKTLPVDLSGADSGTTVVLTELPALVADRAARDALAALGEEPDGGVVALALRHLDALRRLGAPGLALLMPFLGDAQHAPLKDWRSLRTLHNAALLLHVGFLQGRKPLAIPVRIQAELIERGGAELQPGFCSAQIGAVLLSGKASYRELETVLSTEDVYNLVELLNLDALRARLAQDKPPKP
jgi:hypothetical protein